MSNVWLDAQERADAWPLRYKAGKDIEPPYRLVVTAGLHRIGEQSPYWSVTAELVNKRRRGDYAIEACGPLDEEVLEHFPELAPVVALHLSNDEGVPMHAVDNAIYFMGLTRRQEHNGRELPALDILARHLRITEEEAADLVERHPTSTVALVDEIKAMAPRWAGESAAARELLTKLIESQS